MNLIHHSYKNHILDSIFEINKNLNSEYNQYILNIMDTDNEIDKDILYSIKNIINSEEDIDDIVNINKIFYIFLSFF